MDFIKLILEDLRNDFTSFSKILFVIVLIGLGILAISMVFFSYKLTNVDVPCGLIASLIIAITLHQYKLSIKE